MSQPSNRPSNRPSSRPSIRPSIRPSSRPRVRYALPLVAVALLASACTGTTPSASHTPKPSSGQQSQGAGAPSTPASPRTSTAPAQPTRSPSAPSTTQAAATGSQPCPTAQLDVALKSKGAAAGSTYQRLVFTNAGQDTCTLTGFPGVSLVQHRNGAPIGAPADRTGQGGTVSLAPGQSAQATLQITDAQNYPQEKCGQTPAKGLQIYPPNQNRVRVRPGRRARLRGPGHPDPARPACARRFLTSA